MAIPSNKSIRRVTYNSVNIPLVGPTLQSKTATPSLTSVAVTPDSGYDGLSTVTVNPVTGTLLHNLDSDFVADNIKAGVDLFGVTGTHQGGDLTIDTIVTNQLSGMIAGSASFIGSFALAYQSISEVAFPSCTTIGVSAFYRCSELTSISFPVCTSIGAYAFAYCTSLATVSFPSCISIGNNVFQDCSKLTTVSFSVCKSIGSYAFYDCYSLTTASFPVCTSISNAAFYYCYSLTTISFPDCSYIGASAFNQCSRLATASFPACTTVSSYAFQSCSRLTTVSFPVCTSIGNSAFYYCRTLLSLYLLGSSVPRLGSVNAFNSTPISNYTTSTGGVYGSIIVQASMLDTFKTATNWSVYSSRFSVWNGTD